MSTEQEVVGINDPGIGTVPQDATEAAIERVRSQEAFERRAYVQFEVMKTLGFLPSRFDSMSSVIDYTKLNPEECEKVLMWSADVNAVKDTSYATIFEEEYRGMLNNKDEPNLLESRPDQAIKKLAIAIKQRRKN